MKQAAELTKFLEKAFKVKSSDIHLERNTSNGWSIRIKTDFLFTIGVLHDHYCCGINHMGNTSWNQTLFRQLNKSDENKLGILIMDWIAESAREIVSMKDWSKGLLTWSHTTECWITNVLVQNELNTSGNWKLVSEFMNPNSGNQVYVFHCDISDGEDHTLEDDDDDDEYDDYEIEAERGDLY